MYTKTLWGPKGNRVTLPPPTRDSASPPQMTINAVNISIWRHHRSNNSVSTVYVLHGDQEHSPMRSPYNITGPMCGEAIEGMHVHVTIEVYILLWFIWGRVKPSLEEPLFRAISTETKLNARRAFQKHYGDVSCNTFLYCKHVVGISVAKSSGDMS